MIAVLKVDKVGKSSVLVEGSLLTKSSISLSQEELAKFAEKFPRYSKNIPYQNLKVRHFLHEDEEDYILELSLINVEGSRPGELINAVIFSRYFSKSITDVFEELNKINDNAFEYITNNYEEIYI